jgi:hypothetical protein
MHLSPPAKDSAIRLLSIGTERGFGHILETRDLKRESREAQW